MHDQTHRPSGNEVPTSPRRLRHAAETLLAGKPRRKMPAVPAAELAHEFEVYRIELEMQNEALRESQLELEKSRDRFMDYFQFAPVGYLTLSEKGLIAEVNMAGKSLLGTEGGKLLHQPFARFVVPEDADRWHLHFVAALRSDDRQSCELRLRRGDATQIQVRLDSLRLVREGAPATLRITLVDLTSCKQAEDDLRGAAIAFASENGVMITDPGLTILRINPAFTRLTGFTATDAIGKTPAMLKLGHHGSQFYQQMRESLKETGYWQGEMWSQRKNGQLRARVLNLAAVHTSGQGITHYIGTMTDITAGREVESDLHRLAYYDALTHLPNRRLLQDRLGQAISSSVRSGLYGAILFIDLDNFKALNDTRGHDVGDLLLIEIAQRMRALVRGGDTVSRLGGDEFVLLLEDLSTQADEAATLARQLGEKLYAALAVPFLLNGYEYPCKLSIGVSLFDQRNTVEDLLKNADLALYQAKKAGRNTLCFFDPTMQTALDQRISVEAELRQALLLRQFQLFYQPQVDGARHLVAAEALLRWQHPQRGLVPTDEFVQLAEDTSLILSIGLLVLKAATSQLKAWEDDPALSGLRVSVNVSSRQFRQNDFVAQLQGVLHASGANPARLKLELSEGMVLADVQGAVEKMQAIRRLGVGFSMDGFGSEPFPLALLAQLPIEEIKIERAFVSRLSENDLAIVRTLLNLGQSLSMVVVAQGVETQAQMDILERLGGHVFQGHLFSLPLPLAEFEAFAQRN